ncbi:hypothetical protein SNE40_004803 [Patella caerulea]|uniref:Uncharacterized protein n=1 Tax=Patella caerulea TaxID=87958 RepID=A0AAN8KCR3_PATCE
MATTTIKPTNAAIVESGSVVTVLALGVTSVPVLGVTSVIEGVYVVPILVLGVTSVPAPGVTSVIEGVYVVPILVLGVTSVPAPGVTPVIEGVYVVPIPVLCVTSVPAPGVTSVITSPQCYLGDPRRRRREKSNTIMIKLIVCVFNHVVPENDTMELNKSIILSLYVMISGNSFMLPLCMKLKCVI